MAKKKSSHRSSRNSRHTSKRTYRWSGFFLLFLVIGFVLYCSDHRDQLPESVRRFTPTISFPEFNTIEKGIEETAEKTKKMVVNTAEKAKEITAETTNKIKDLASSKQPSAHTERKSTTPAQSSTQTSTATTSSSFQLQLEIPRNTVSRQETILKKRGFTLSYSTYYRNPIWVAWELTREETTGEAGRNARFEPDPALKGSRVTHDDYTHSGFDRGHMAPAADMKWDKQAMKESFYTTNICPQNKTLNRGDWSDLEELSRKWGRKYGRVYIVCGPVYKAPSPKRLKKGNVAIPDQFFKAILIYNQKNPMAMGFLFDNKARSQSLNKYMVTVDSLEALTGLDFFSRVPDSIEEKIESVIPSLPF